ncbi:hypothetical protein DFH08DRAFT_796928 [Mycena albidolilacea]|uniref:Uncharacterized protein n=1 Tax=Mycena albidolilacea TaxID=1033008 RepID=A0AAD7AWQ9_9AGAR|nr:hypothetical protein DFH08DRAFT_796928 [Mycena albidolilacea]
MFSLRRLFFIAAIVLKVYGAVGGEHPPAVRLTPFKPQIVNNVLPQRPATVIEGLLVARPCPAGRMLIQFTQPATLDTGVTLYVFNRSFHTCPARIPNFRLLHVLREGLRQFGLGSEWIQLLRRSENRDLAQKPHKPHAAFGHCAKPRAETKVEVRKKTELVKG